jgi:hypothetical protein
MEERNEWPVCVCVYVRHHVDGDQQQRETLRLRRARALQAALWRSRLPPLLANSLSYLFHLPTPSHNLPPPRFPPPFFFVPGVYIAGQSVPGLGSVSPETSYSEHREAFSPLILSSLIWSYSNISNTSTFSPHTCYLLFSGWLGISIKTSNGTKMTGQVPPLQMWNN